MQLNSYKVLFFFFIFVVGCSYSPDTTPEIKGRWVVNYDATLSAMLKKYPDTSPLKIALSKCFLTNEYLEIDATTIKDVIIKNECSFSGKTTLIDGHEIIVNYSYISHKNNTSRVEFKNDGGDKEELVFNWVDDNNFWILSYGVRDITRIYYRRE